MIESDFFAVVKAEIFRSWNEFGLLTIPPLTLICLFFVVVFGITKISRIKLPQMSYTLLSSFVLVGLVPGIVAGYSQQAIAGTFLTATVGVITSLIAFGFAKDSLEEWRPLMPFLIIATLFGALVGFSTGGVSKSKWLEYDQAIAQRNAEMEKIFVPMEFERQKENLRRFTLTNKTQFITRQDVVEINNQSAPK